MIETKFIDNFSEINALLPEWRELARRSGSELPFHQMELPLEWWRHFGSHTGQDFGRMRGRNFWGNQSWIEKFGLLIATAEAQIVGLAPLVTIRIQISGLAEPVRMLALAGDSVLMAYQDLLTAPENRDQIVAQLITALVEQTGHDLLFLGNLPEDSPHLASLRAHLAAYRNDGWAGGETINRRRGGMQPWTMAAIAHAGSKLLELVTEEEIHASLAQFLEKLAVLKPESLLFPRTRVNLELQISTLIDRIAETPQNREWLEEIKKLLNPEAIPYPKLQLPSDRDQYLQSLSKDTRRYFRRYGARFLEAGGSFEKISAGDITSQDLDDYLNLHARRWQAESAAVNDLSMDFHRDLGLALAGQDYFTLFFARFNGKRIAAHSCFDIGKRREGYFTGRDPDFEELRASRLLYLETILDAIDHGFTTYDLGYGGDAYKLSFANIIAHVHHFILAPAHKIPDLDKVFPKYEYVAFN